MKRALATGFILTLFAAALAFGHAGEKHTYMGTVDAVQSDGSFALKEKSGVTHNVRVSEKTKFVFADGTAASSKDLANGTRAVVTISTDGETAERIKLASRR